MGFDFRNDDTSQGGGAQSKSVKLRGAWLSQLEQVSRLTHRHR